MFHFPYGGRFQRRLRPGVCISGYPENVVVRSSSYRLACGRNWDRHGNSLCCRLCNTSGSRRRGFLRKSTEQFQFSLSNAVHSELVLLGKDLMNGSFGETRSDRFLCVRCLLLFDATSTNEYRSLDSQISLVRLSLHVIDRIRVTNIRIESENR